MRASLRIRTMREGRTLLEKDPILHRIVEVIVREIDPDKIILFGSRARGDYKEGSDYDILVLKEGVRPEERRKLQARIRLKLLDAGIYRYADIDVVVQDPNRYEELSHKWYLIYYDIKKEGRVIYDRERGRIAVA